MCAQCKASASVSSFPAGGPSLLSLSLSSISPLSPLSPPSDFWASLFQGDQELGCGRVWDKCPGTDPPPEAKKWVSHRNGERERGERGEEEYEYQSVGRFLKLYLYMRKARGFYDSSGYGLVITQIQ